MTETSPSAFVDSGTAPKNSEPEKMKSDGPPSDNVPQGKSWVDLKLLKRFSRYLRPYKRELIIGLLPIPVSVICSIAFPWLIIQIIDQQLVTGIWEGMPFWISLLCLVLVCNYLANTCYSYFVQKAAQKAIRDLRKDMFDRVLHFPRRYFDSTPMGVTLTRLTSDLEAINESLASGLLSMMRDLLITGALLIFLTSISWRLTLVTLVVAPPIYIVIRLLRRRLHRAYLQSRQVLSQGTGYLQECLQGIKTIQLYSAEREVQKKYQSYTEAFFLTQSRSNFYDAGLFAIIEGITTISMGLIIWYGATEILAATITLGVLIAFIQTLDKIFVPIRDVTSQIASIQRALAALTHIEVIFREPVENENDIELAENLEAQMLEGQLQSFRSLEFKHVRFRYNDANPYVLDDVSFTLQRGQKIALVGSTGSGKSTILRLLTKTYSGYEGSITFNGIELNEIPKPIVAQFFSLMQQETYLFDKSIEFNISLDRPQIDRNATKAAARYVYADEFIEKLPLAYDFQLVQNGSNLSAGQAQLIAFARAIAGGSDVVLLDEATSSVDSLTEHMIQRAINHVFAEKTVIAIAHRLSTIQHSDKILVLDQGKIIEEGDHETLLALCGFYANLVSVVDR
ncbi:MAG: ATP-binding cassette subfamily B multidrug efflux pump [Oceanicoccus sp.]|jgi:ATP-binding cassette subfamily B multidrug efflux pump